MTTPISSRVLTRPVVLGALLPAFIFSTGLGAVIPVLASFSVERGATLAVAGLIAAMLPVGQILADLPAGALASRVGDRRGMLIAGAAAVLGFVGAGLSPGFLTLAAAVLLVGAANAMFHLARHSYLTAVTPAGQRARVLSTLGGVHRVGQFVGPFLGAAVALLGDLRWVFALAALTAGAAAVTVLLTKVGASEPVSGPTRRQATEVKPSPVAAVQRLSMGKILVEYRKVLMRLGLAAILVGVIRGAKQQVLPLWGEHLGLDPTMIAVIYGLSNGIDMLLFYPAGKIMDSFGRLWVGVPAMVGLGAAMALVPLTTNAWMLLVVGIVMGFSNGMGSGIMMTISSDIAPEVGRPQFLAAWRLLSDCGMGAGPLTLAAGAAVSSLAAGVWVVAACGPLAAGAMLRWLPQYSVHASRKSRRRAGLTQS